ncbi:beta-glucosidase 16-like [Euphorbia lathyris]|uniref:beta-glucosidase 16-like n=1 Tax=Euphorbia lathyris TaxID=212925 RepID=UPI00331347A3
MKNLGFNVYRLSISWPRVLPEGSLKGGVNQKGIDYYNNLINELLANGITPIVTLFHWDTPQALEDKYLGFLGPQIVEDFRDYANLCFNTFGDRVKIWLTMDEPLTFSTAYSTGTFAPGRCTNRTRCNAGNAATECYIVAHYQLLAHAAAVKVYREKYQVSQKGQIGIVLNTAWVIPLTDSSDDLLAKARALAFQVVFDTLKVYEPLYHGSYPAEMVDRVGTRLPTFTKEESNLVKGSYDFIGMNYYTTLYVSHSVCQNFKVTYDSDRCVNGTGMLIHIPTLNYINAHSIFPLLTLLSLHFKIQHQNKRNGIPIGPRAGTWIFVYPPGLKELLLYVKNKYNDPTIYITENGVIDSNIDDKFRVEYYQGHIAELSEAKKQGVKVKGYMAWSLLDTFEWMDGYTSRFGIVHIDYENGLKRTLRSSALWFKEFLKVQK